MMENLKDIFYQRIFDSLRRKPLPDTIRHDKDFLEYCLKNGRSEFWMQFEPSMFDENIVNRYGEEIVRAFGGIVPNRFRLNEGFFGFCLRNGKWDLVKQFDERLVTDKIVRGNEANILEAYHGIPKNFEKNSELLMFCLNNKRYDFLTQFDEHLFSTEIVNKYGESIINFAIKNGRFDYLEYFEPYNLFSQEEIQSRTDEILKKLSGQLPEKLMTSIPLFEACAKNNREDLLKQFGYLFFPNDYIERNADVIAKYIETPSAGLFKSVSFFEACAKNNREDLLMQFDYSCIPNEYIERNADVIAKCIETPSDHLILNVSFFEACVKNNREDLLKQFDYSVIPEEYIERNADVIVKCVETLSKGLNSSVSFFEACVKNNREDLLIQFDDFFIKKFGLVYIASRDLNDSNNIKLLLLFMGKLCRGSGDEIEAVKPMSDILSFLMNDEEKFQLLCNNESFSNFFLKTLKRDSFFQICDEVENFQKNFLNQSKLALRYILESEENTFQYLYVLRNSGISNRLVDEYNRNFELLQKVKPNISLGNTSLRKEMLQDDFIKILGFNYINTILIYNTEACDIVVDIYQKGELQDLRDWLDYCTSNIAKNGYQIHQFILSYNNMKSLVKEVMDVQKQGVQLDEEQLFVIEQITNNENKYGIHSMSDIPDYYKKRFDFLSQKNDNYSAVSSLFDTYPGEILGSNDSTFDFTKTILYSDLYEFFVMRGLITEEEIQYLSPIFEWISANMKLEKLMFREGYFDLVKSNQVMMMTKKISQRIRDFQNKRLNEHLTSISELKKKASKTDKSSDIYLECIDDIEVITIKDTPFHIFDNQVRYKKGSAHNQKHTEEHMQYVQFEMFSEGLKDKIRTSGDCISKLDNKEILLDYPNAWNELEAIQTISCANMHPFTVFDDSFDVGFGFGADSNLLLRGVSSRDLNISHRVRKRFNDDTKQYLNISSLYDISGADDIVGCGETFFDRNCEKGENFDNILKPEFIVTYSGEGRDKVLASNVERAKVLGVNTVLVLPESYSETDHKKIILKVQKELLETLDMKLVWDLYYSPIEEVNGIKALDQVLLILKDHLTSKKITQEEYLQKIQELRYECYDVNKEALKELDMLLGKTDERKDLIEDNRGVKKR